MTKLMSFVTNLVDGAGIKNLTRITDLPRCSFCLLVLRRQQQDVQILLVGSNVVDYLYLVVCMKTRFPRINELFSS